MAAGRYDARGGTRISRVAAIVVIAWALSEPVLLSGGAPRGTALAFGLLVAMPLLAVRRWPIAVAVTVVAAYLAQFALQVRMDDAMSSEMAVAFALFGVSAYASASRRRAAGAVAVAAGVPIGVWVISALDVGKVEVVSASQYVYLCGVAFAGAVPGFALASRVREVRGLEAEVERLCAAAATEIGAAVDGERRALGRELVRVIDGLVGEIQALVVSARRALLEHDPPPERLGRQMAEAAGAAGMQLRALLSALTADDVADAAAGHRSLQLNAGALRAMAGLALPVVLLGALAVIDRTQLPPLPLTAATTSGTSITVEPSALPPALGYLLAACTPIGLLWRRRAPALAVGLVAATLALRAGVGELNSLLIAHVFAIGALAYAAGAWSRTLREALAGLAITVLTAALCWHLEEYHFATLVYAYMLGVLVATWLVGRGVRNDLRDALALRDRATELRAHRDRLRALAIRGQRRDVARELHDVVGHGLSLIVVQAGVVDVFAARDPGRATMALDLVDEAARGTRTEVEALRDALSTRGSGSDAGAACRDALTRIVDDARAAGQPILALVDPRVDELDGAQRAALVRIAQEALTNARKHAGSAAATLEVEVRGDLVRMSVRNEAGAAPARQLPGSGLGVRGMADRASAQGGTFRAGPSGRGGWSVLAEFPREVGASLGAIRGSAGAGAAILKP